MVSDPFLSDPARKRKKSVPKRNTSLVSRKKSKSAAATSSTANQEDVDEEISGISDSDEEEQEQINEENEQDVLSSDDEFAGESAADKRRRLAKQYLENLANEYQDEGEEGGAFDAADLDRDIIASRLKQDVAEQKGYVYKFIADNLLIKDCKPKISRVGSMSLTSLSIHYPYCYTTSKDMELSKWDISNVNKKPIRKKYVKGGLNFIEINKEPHKNGHMDEIYCCCASPNGKYVVTGGKDKRLIIWSTENLSVLKVLETNSKKGEIFGLIFKRNSDQLYAACGDLKIRTYSINQFAHLETLYGHQDLVVDISALAQERCVTVGSRDRTAMLWKIAEETRLTFRGGDSESTKKKSKRQQQDDSQKNGKEEYFNEGSIDCISMIDDSHFITGSDNGNISLWSTAKKRPQFTQRIAHGLIPEKTPAQSSAESNLSLASTQISKPQPYWITSVYALPYANVFFSGSWNGTIKIWKLSDDLRSFISIGELPNAKGVVTKIEAIEDDSENIKKLRVLATLSKEHRLGRWVKLHGNGARNALFSAVIEYQNLKPK